MSAPSEHRDPALKPILIAGPTASGKSALAMSIARYYGGTIINADSMQVYSDLRILTARPSASDEAAVPHALYGFVLASEAYSVGRFVTDAALAISSSQRLGRRPILVGGTGLYFKALLEGLSPIPQVPEVVRAFWRSKAEQVAPDELHAELARRDPAAAARLAQTDSQRLVRALEVFEATGRSVVEWQQERGVPVLDAADTIRIRVAGERGDLHARADSRFDKMVELGALEEASRLAASNLDPGLPAMRAIGVAPLIKVVRHELPLSAALETAKAETRQYIKRQETWARRYMISWQPYDMKYLESHASKIIALIDEWG